MSVEEYDVRAKKMHYSKVRLRPGYYQSFLSVVPDDQKTNFLILFSNQAEFFATRVVTVAFSFIITQSRFSSNSR
jgi:hypothetical protein